MSKWPIKKLDKHIIESKERYGSEKLNGIQVLSVTNDQGFVFSDKRTSENVSNYKIIKNGYFAYNPYRINVGSLAFAGDEYSGIVSPAYVVFSCAKDLDPEYLWKYLKSDVGLFHIRQSGKGSVRSSLSFERLQQIEIPFPPLSEQKRIMKRINDIEERLILLNKEHVRLSKLLGALKRSFFERNYRHSENIGKNYTFQKGNFPTQKTSGSKFPFITVSGEKRFADDFDVEGPAVCVPMISATGHGHASLKRIFYSDGRFALANIIGALLPNEKCKIEPRYLYFYLSELKDDVLIPLMKGTANVSLPKERLLDVVLSFPETKEQISVLNILDKTDKVIHEINQSSEWMRKLMPSTLAKAFNGEA